MKSVEYICFHFEGMVLYLNVGCSGFKQLLPFF